MIPGRARHKYGARRTQCALNHFHASAHEASVCALLVLREKAGDIRNLKYQHTVHLPHAIKWRVDFSFEQGPSWILTLAEVKGFATADFKLKLKIYRDVGEHPLELWYGDHRRPKLTEIVKPKVVVKSPEPQN